MSIALYRQFPTPWSVQELPACFIVREINNQSLAHVHFEERSGYQGVRSEPPCYGSDIPKLCGTIERFPPF
jgi:hypothetical protein